MKTAICPGSFDPVTVGHMDIITRAAALFDQVVVLVSVNSAKRGFFTPQQRVALLQAACAGLVNVQVVSTPELVADVARRMGATVLVKGLRTGADFEYEAPIAQVNSRLCPGLESVYLAAAPAVSWVSSTVAREMLRYGQSTEGIIPAACALLVRQFLQQN